MKLNLSIKNSTRASITPQLQNAIKLLQFTAVEINQEIQNIFESNPLIEKEDICEDFLEDNCTEHYLHYDKDFPSKTTSTVSTSEIIEKTTSEEETINKHLLWQVHLSNMSDIDKSIAESITDYVNNDGYLIKDIEEIFDDLYLDSEILLDEVIAVQHFLQNLDPVGTCSRDLQESLIIQVQNTNEDSDLKNKIYILLNEFFEEYSKKDFKIIKNSLGISEDEFILIDDIIKKQNPRPGNIINNVKDYNYIIPDIEIIKNDSNWIIKNNKAVSPKIKINKDYIDINENNLSDEDKKYVKEKLQEAKLFIKNINYRSDTLLALSKEIFDKQKKFFEYGIENLVPMNLKDVADDLNVHESTVSRLTNGKYMETPYGIFELKFFFSSSLINEDGKGFSSNSIKEKIRKIILHENKKAPYSDNRIKDILKKNGIDIARRTITKYRDSLNIDSSSKRKDK